jgi:hypothetical protein
MVVVIGKNLVLVNLVGYVSTKTGGLNEFAM